MGNVHSKNHGAVLGGLVAVAGVTSGIAALVCFAPVTLCGTLALGAAGGALIGGGIASGVSTVKQCWSKEKEFRYGELAAEVGIGALGGAITAPISLAGGVVAKELTTQCTKAAITLAGGVVTKAQCAKAAIILGAETIGGAVAGTVTHPLSKLASGQKVSMGDCAKGALIGGVSGLVGGAFGLASSKTCAVGARGCAPMTERLTRGGIGATFGAVGGCVGGTATKVVENVCEGEKWSNGVGQAAVQGLITGAAGGLISSSVKADRKIRDGERPALSSAARPAAQNTAVYAEVAQSSGENRASISVDSNPTAEAHVQTHNESGSTSAAVSRRITSGSLRERSRLVDGDSSQCGSPSESKPLLAKLDRDQSSRRCFNHHTKKVQ